MSQTNLIYAAVAVVVIVLAGWFFLGSDEADVVAPEATTTEPATPAEPAAPAGN